MTASWEEFSQNVLNSDAVVTLVDILTNIVDFLNSIVSLGDGVVGSILLITGTLISLIAVLKACNIQIGVITSKLGAGFVGALKSPYTWIVLFISVLISLKDRFSEAGQTIVTILSVIGIAFIVFSKTVGTAIKNIPIIGWIVAGIELLLSLAAILVGVLQKNQNEAREDALQSAEALQKEADALNEVADAARKTQEEIKSLADEFRELEDATKSDWYDTLLGLGDKATGLFDENLTPFEAILKLLGDTYTYEQLINASEEDRLKILTQIEKATAAVSYKNQQEAYEAQHKATTSQINALGMEARVGKGDETWGDRSRSSKKTAINSAAHILEGTGVNIERDGASANITFDVKNDENGNIDKTDYINKLQNAVDKFQAAYAHDLTQLNDNAIYQFLNSSLESAKNSLIAEIDSAKGMLQSATLDAGSGIAVDLSKDLTSEYERVKDEIKSVLQDNGALNSLFDEEELEQSAVDYIRKYYEELYNAANKVAPPVVIEFKSLNEAFDETESKFDVISTAMEEMSESGRLTADTISKISSEFPELLKYLDLSEEGFGKLDYSIGRMYDKLKLAAIENVNNAKEQYEAALDEYNNSEVKTKEAHDDVVSKGKILEEAIKSAEYLQVTETARTRELLEKRFADSFEKQTEALEEQKDAFSELCDIRKDLINSYKEELDYQNKLQKQQRKVSSLNSQLAVARLDTSAAGQARVRELESELEEAETELEDMTLEHAIDTLVEEIENENKQYEDFIDKEITNLKNKIESISKMSTEELVEAIKSSGATTNDITGDQSVSNDFKEAISSGSGAGEKQPDSFTTSKEELRKRAQDFVDTWQMTDDERDNWRRDARFNELISEYESAGGSMDDIKGYTGKPKEPTNTGVLDSSKYSVSGLNGGFESDDVDLKIDGVNYDLLAGTKDITDTVKNALNKVSGSNSPPNGQVVAYQGALYISTKEGWRKMKSDWSDVNEAASAYLALLNSYHTGGFVGGLESNEEFAKLLKGEFVVTPAQMQSFMNHTLPNIVNHGQGGHEFNAPLISIQCESVTTETMPKLEQVVDKAVKQIQDCLDKGMNRMGHRTSKQKLLF